jgi:N-acetylated-alpha-linked acidic dipeptidase
MLEEARSIGELAKSGWRPKRTLIYCSWDGEEQGLLGSTEWAEYHGPELQQKAVVYINSDASGRGFFYAEGSQALTTMVDEVSKDISDPETKVSVFERKKASVIVNASSAKSKKDILNKQVYELGALGSGSDFSPFLQHLAVPSLNVGYGGEDGGGEYHSIYDSYADYVRFKDPGFYYGVTLAQTTGHMALRMSNADVLPFDFTILYNTINTYTKELSDLLQQLKESTEMENYLITSRDYMLAADPTTTFIVPKLKAEVPYLDFSPLQNALSTLQKSSDSLKAFWNKAIEREGDHEKLNKALYQAEQQLIAAEGLPRRNWYRHTLYAPGFYTGYGVKTMPGIREAIEQRNWQEAQEQVKVDALAITKLANYLTEITLKGD